MLKILRILSLLYYDDEKMPVWRKANEGDVKDDDGHCHDYDESISTFTKIKAKTIEVAVVMQPLKG